MECQLTRTVSNYERGTDCDGCGRTIPAGEPHLGDIDSCCGGGCCRHLCKECVRVAAELLKDD